MKTENFIFDQSGQRKKHKNIREHFPDSFIIVLFEALIIKPIDLINLCRLMIPSQKSDPISILDFKD
jgi:hypothetical protein